MCSFMSNSMTCPPRLRILFCMASTASLSRRGIRTAGTLCCLVFPGFHSVSALSPEDCHVQPGLVEQEFQHPCGLAQSYVLGASPSFLAHSVSVRLRSRRQPRGWVPGLSVYKTAAPMAFVASVVRGDSPTNGFSPVYFNDAGHGVG